MVVAKNRSCGWFSTLFGFRKKDENFKIHVERKYESALLGAERDLLDETGGIVDFLEMELQDEEKEVDEIVKEANAESQALIEEEIQLRNELAALRKELFNKQDARGVLSIQTDEMTMKAGLEKKAQDEQQYDRALQLQDDLEKLRRDMETYFAEAVRNAKQELESKLCSGRMKLIALQEQIKKEESEFALAIETVGQQKSDLERLQSAIQYQTRMLEDREKVWSSHETELDQLKKTNIELRRLSETQKPVKEVSDEIRVFRSRNEMIPGFAVIGNDIDLWIDKTKINIKACIGSFGTNGESYLREYRDIRPDGFLCQCCGCGVGPHQISRCYVCRLLDMSDASIFP